MARRTPPGSLVVLLLGMQRFVGLRLGAASGSPRGRGRALAPKSEPVVPPLDTDALARASRRPRDAEPRGERGRTRSPVVDWAARFSDELVGIARAEGSRAPPVVETDAVPNVGANAAVVLVNARWMQRASDEICGERASCRRDLVRGIAAHEWSHVIDARRGDASDGHDKELRADRTAGRILAESGASARPLLQLLADDRAGPSSTHPSAGERVDAVLAGQRDARGGCLGEGTCRCCDGSADDDDAIS